MYKIVLNFVKSFVLSCFTKFDINIEFLKYDYPKLKLRVFLVGHTVGMVTYSVTKMITTCSPMTGQFFETIILASTDKE